MEHKAMTIEKAQELSKTSKHIKIENFNIDLAKDYIKITSAVGLNNFNKDILFTLKETSGLYIGKKEYYQTLGIYDNTSETLTKISDNEKLLSLLNGQYSHIALAGFLVSGEYSLDEIIEFYEICSKLNMKYYDFMSESDNKILYDFTNEKKERREQNGTKRTKRNR